MPPPASHHRLCQFGALATAALLLSGCGGIPLLPAESTAVVYALGSREGFPSPLGRQLTPACPALAFTGDGFNTSGRHRLGLQQFAESAKASETRYLIVGYTSPGIPEDHARSLSERRAQAVRQTLIELGIEAARLQTVGLGNDFAPSGPSSDVVVIYHTTPQNPQTPPPPPDAATQNEEGSATDAPPENEKGKPRSGGGRSRGSATA